MASSSTPTPGPGTTDRDAPIYLYADRAVGEKLALELRHHGFKVRAFVNTDVLRNAARTQPPALLILALDDAATALTRDLRDSAQDARLPVIFVSERDDTRTRLRAVQAGGSAFLPHPINRSALIHLVRLHIRQPAEEPVRVLLIGEADVEEMIAPLRERGIELSRLGTPSGALEALRDCAYACLLVTEPAGRCSAAELIRTVRQEPSFYDLPALVLTAGDKRRLDQAVSTAGADALLGLPVEADDLAAVIHARVRRIRGLRAAYRYLARHDPATGLASRDHFDEELERALDTLEGSSRMPALLYLEFERNTTLHGRGCDPQAAQLADQLLRELPATAIAAQVADNAFAILLHHIEAGALERLADKLARKLNADSLRAGQGVSNEACHVGVTTIGRHHANAAAVLASARQGAALQRSGSDNGKESADHAREEDSRPLWQARVDEALSDNRFRLLYQPIASLSGAPTPYYEVFLRMLNQDGDELSPREFLPALAGSPLEARLDRWVVSRALHVLESQQALQHKPVLFLKLSAGSIVEPGFARWLEDQLAQTRLPGERLVLEITQEVAATRTAETLALIEAVRALGCGVALEHYGANGVQQEELLKAVAPAFVKLAPALTDEIGSNRAQQAQVQAVASLARALGAKSVAVSVQDATHLAVLWRCGIEYLQGYFMQGPADVFAEES